MSLVRAVKSKRSLALGSALLFATAGTALFLGPEANASTSGTGSTQTVTFTGTTNAQLSIVASAGTLSGLSSTLNPVVVTDTEADSQQWTASIQATDCFPAALTGTGAAVLPASAIQINAGSGSQAPTTPLSLNAVSATLGGTFNFNAPTSPGTASAPTYSDPQTLAYAAPYTNPTTHAVDALSNNGVYSLNPTVTVNSSASGFIAVPETYTCQLQYTVTG